MYWICLDCGSANLYPEVTECEVCGRKITPDEISDLHKKTNELKKQEHREKKTEKKKLRKRMHEEKSDPKNQSWYDGKCGFCGRQGLVRDVKIVDEMGTRYRCLCNSCVSQYSNSIVSEKNKSNSFSLFTKKKTKVNPDRRVGKCDFCEKTSVVQEVTIVDDMGTRYRKLCDACRASVISK